MANVGRGVALVKVEWVWNVLMTISVSPTRMKFVTRGLEPWLSCDGQAMHRAASRYEDLS